MKPDDLRALADALDSGTHYVESPELHETMMRAADYLRACADEKAVGYVTANGLRSLRQDDATVLLYAHDYLIRPDHVALYARPAPAVPQAEPETFESELRSFAQTPEQAEFVEKVLAAEPKREPNPNAVICPACTHQFRAIPENVQAQLWAKREPLSDEQIDAALQTDPAATVLGLMAGSLTVGEFKLALRRLARTVEHAHGISGGGHD